MDKNQKLHGQKSFHGQKSKTSVDKNQKPLDKNQITSRTKIKNFMDKRFQKLHGQKSKIKNFTDKNLNFGVAYSKTLRTKIKECSMEFTKFSITYKYNCS